MKKALSDFSKEEKYLVKRMFEEGYTIHEISSLINLSFQEIVFILKRMIDDLDLRSIVPHDSITDEQVIIISDTHLGSKYENLDYLKEVYKFAKEQSIHIILHGGDLIQSTYTNVLPQYVNEVRQLEHVVEDYPISEEIRNYILLGNHDFNTLKKDPLFMEILNSRKDFTILGFKRAYLTWLSSLISLYHSTKRYPLTMPPLETDLTLKGHSHKLSYNKENSIAIPTLSDDLLQHTDARPGFLVGTHKDKTITLESYYFKDSLHREGKILTKKIN